MEYKRKIDWGCLGATLIIIIAVSALVTFLVGVTADFIASSISQILNPR